MKTRTGRITASVIVAAVAAMSFGAAAAENGADKVTASDTESEQGSSSAPLARAGAMVKPPLGEPPALSRAYGFKSITHPAVGVYCLTAVSSIKAKKSVAIVSVNWYGSFGNNLQAMVSEPTYKCPPTAFEVRTFKFAPGGSFVDSDEVSFTIVVP